MCRVVLSLLVLCLCSIPAVSANPSVAAAYSQDQDQGPAPSQEQNPDYQPFSPETPQWEVIENGEYIAIDPLQPRYIYVPVYDPAICYYRRPYWGPAIAFGVGVPIGAWLNLDFRWGYGGGCGGVFYMGWRPWGGWNGGWVDRCRPYVRESNVYINNRYTNITVNRTVINRQVNVTNINHYNYVHNNTGGSARTSLRPLKRAERTRWLSGSITRKAIGITMVWPSTRNIL